MRQIGLALALALGLVLAAGVAGLTQDAAPDTAEATSGGDTVDMSVFVERNELWSEVSGAAAGVSGTFARIRMVAYTGFSAPDTDIRQGHVEQLLSLLQGADASGVDPSAFTSQTVLTRDTQAIAHPGYLLGEGGYLRRLTVALNAYVSFLEQYSDNLAAHYFASKCSSGTCYEGFGRWIIDSQLDRLYRLVERLTVLAEVALDAALRIDPQTSLDASAGDFASIHAVAVTAAGYWPFQKGGELPMPETLPSLLRDFQDIFGALDGDLAAVLSETLLNK